MVFGNLMLRPLRSLVSLLAVAVEVSLVLTIVGLTSGMLKDTAQRIEGVGADIMLQPPSASVFLAFSGAPMPIRIADRLTQVGIRPGRRAGAPRVQLQRRHRSDVRNRSRELPRGLRRLLFRLRPRYDRAGRCAG